MRLDGYGVKSWGLSMLLIMRGGCVWFDSEVHEEVLFVAKLGYQPAPFHE